MHFQVLHIQPLRPWNEHASFSVHMLPVHVNGFGGSVVDIPSLDDGYSVRRFLLASSATLPYSTGKLKCNLGLWLPSVPKIWKLSNRPWTVGHHCSHNQRSEIYTRYRSGERR